jgi:hypothetical protein
VVLSSLTRDYSAIQRQLLPHIQACSQYIIIAELEQTNKSKDKNKLEREEGKNNITYLDRIYRLGLLYIDQGKLGEAEKTYIQAL